MSLITMKNITKSYGERQLFKIEHLNIEEGDRIGLVGHNGSGKTTLFRIIAGLEDPDDGLVERRATVELLPQLKQSMKTKSGGEVTAEYVLRALNKNPKLLLADEPTTHLDISHVEWVEKGFHHFTGAFIVISHDREFLNRVCSKIWELDDHMIKEYSGNYSFYKDEKENQKNYQQTEYEKYMTKRNQLIAAKDKKTRQATNATKRKVDVKDSEYNLKGSAPYYQKKSKKMHQVQKALDTRIEKLEKIDKPKETESIKMELSDLDKLANRFIIRASESVGEVPGKLLWNPSTFSMKTGEKVALVGPNGSGKTTLINKLLHGDARISVLPSIKIGFFSQNLSTLEVSRSILDNVKKDAIQSETLIRIVLAQLNFKNNDVYKQVNVLSGGERVKVSLAKLLVGDYNMLVLDEPTNFLDIQAVESLENLLNEYEGSIVFVSHDRLFIDHIASKLWVIEDQRIAEVNQSFSEWENGKRSIAMSNSEEDLMRIKNKITEVLSDLSIQPSDEKEKEFQELLKQKKKIESEI